jgi:release factor glutamine methyltransferase
MESWTIQKLLGWVTEYFTGKGIDAPRLSAEWLLCYVLGLKRIELYTQFNKVIGQEQLSRLHELVKRAGAHEPIAYITGKKEFYSLEFEITKDCLIPRPETELLVERAIEFLRTRTGEQFICDLCTGSGCVAVAIARNFAGCRIVATDISDATLTVAGKNVAKHGLTNRIKLLQGDLFGPVIAGLGPAKFDLIVSNPPYVSEPEYEKLAPNVKDFEPRSALTAGKDGLDIIKKIIADANQHLKPAGTLMLEIGNEQANAVHKLLETAGCFNSIKIEKDYANLDRLAVAILKNSRHKENS